MTRKKSVSDKMEKVVKSLGVASENADDTEQVDDLLAANLLRVNHA